MERTKAMRALLDIDDDTDSEKSDSTVKPNLQPTPRYLYYRLFTEDIRFSSKHPAFPNNSYIGRVKASSIAPPLTVLMIKRRLCMNEDISDYPNSSLFLSETSQSPNNDGDRVAILTPGSPGSTPEKPMKLIVKLSYFGKPELNKLSVISPNSRYIYYSLYSEDGEISTKHPINSNPDSHALARININLVPPPHTVNSIIRCISYIEGFSFCFWHRLFPENASEFPYKAKDILTLTSGGPGSTPERPLAFVRSAGMTKRFRLKHTAATERDGLLTVGRSDILYTDGVVRQEVLVRDSVLEQYFQSVNSTPYVTTSWYEEVYRVRNDSNGGQHGFVLKNDVTL